MQLPAPSPDGDFVSALFTRGARGVPGSPAPSRGSGGERSRSPASSRLSWGRCPGPAFLGLPTYFPTLSGWAGREARRRAGLDRRAALRGPGGVVPAEEPAGHGASGAAEVAESISAGLEGVEAGLHPAAPAGNKEQPGRHLPEGGGSSRGPGAASVSLSPSSIPTCRSPAGHPLPWAGAGPRRRPPHGCGCDRCGSEREGSAGMVTVPGCQPGQPTRPAPRARLVVLRAGSTACAVTPPACSVPDRSLSPLCGKS